MNPKIAMITKKTLGKFLVIFVTSRSS